MKLTTTIALTDDLIRYWRSRIKGQGHTFVQVCDGESIHDNAVVSKPIFWLYI